LASLNRDRYTNTTPCKFKCKAAQTPILIAWLASLAAEFAQACPAALQHEANLVSACCWGLHTYFVVLRTSGRFFTDEQLALLERAADTCLNSYSQLARIRGGVAFWHHIPKMHQMQHLVLDAREDLANPHFFSCFSDEDLIGQMLRLSRQGHALTVVDHVVSCYIVGAKQRLEHAC
jgi:hypothetical protein